MEVKEQISSKTIKVVQFETYPGSGTHLLLDCLKILKVPHIPIGLLIRALLVSKKSSKQLSSDDLGIENKQLFEKLYAAMPDQLDDKSLFNDFLKIMTEYLGSLNFDSAVIVQPHVSFVQELKYEDRIIEWAHKDIVDYHNIIKWSVDEIGGEHKTIAFCRSPIDLISSKNSRFKRGRYGIETEIKQLSSFVNFISSNKLEVFKYEDLCMHPAQKIAKLIQLLNVKGVEKEHVLSAINFSTIGINKVHGLSKEEKKEVVAQVGDITGMLNYDIKEINSPLYFMRKTIDIFIWEFQESNKFLLDGDFSNDAAISRHKKTFFCRVYQYILKMFFKKARLNANKFSKG
tara:strand:+ start:727 stop:1761 length:1035 start_codon:yes stop_codon:yes gene_type:complete